MALVVLAACGGSDGPPGPGAPVVARVDLSPSSTTLDVDSTVTLAAVARDAEGRMVPGATYEWSHAGSTYARILATTGGSVAVLGLAAGADTITVRSGEKMATAVLSIRPRRVLRAILDADALSFGALDARDTLLLRLEDQYGPRTMSGVPNFASVDTLVASVDAAGVVRARGNGPTSIIATVDGVADTVAVVVRQVPLPPPPTLGTITPSPFAIYGGDTVRIRLTAVDANGHPVDPRLFTWKSSVPARAAVDASGLVTGSSAGATIISASFDGQVWAESRGWVVGGARGAFPLASLSAGARHVCGLNTGGALHCWGDNEARQLGIGDAAIPPTPRARLVADSLRFRSVTAGESFTCALGLDGAAYCWGRNGTGQLGVGTHGAFALGSPAKVLGDLRFSRIGVSNADGLSSSYGNSGSACGVTVNGALFCWGSNFHGQLGRVAATQCNPPMSVGCELAPAPVAPTLVWRDVDVGAYHACALTEAGRAYCWGHPVAGAVGIGDVAPFPDDIFQPTATVTSARFVGLALGDYSSCALTSAGALHCWGQVNGRNIPTEMPGGIALRAVDVGYRVVCGIDHVGDVYCWGPATNPLLGDGGRLQGSMPRRVVGISGAVAVTVGTSVACASTAVATHCWGLNRSGTLGIGPYDEGFGSSIPVRILGAL